VSAPPGGASAFLVNWRDWTVGPNLVALACVLRATTKIKVVNFFGEQKCTPRENPGYAYEM